MADDGGLARFQARMRAIPKAAREAVRPALVKGAEEIAGAAKNLAPVDEGDLRDSVEVTAPGGTTPGGTALHELQAAVSTDDYKARWVEFGTVKMAARPFFWPAFRLHRKRAANRIKRAIGKAVREARR